MYTIRFMNSKYEERYSNTTDSYAAACDAAERYQKFYPRRKVWVIDNQTGEIVWGA